MKVFYISKPAVDPYMMTYRLIPSQAVTCSDAKQMYINGYFCYTDKFAIHTNGLGIVQHIAFIDHNDFKAVYPNLIMEKKTISL